MVLHLAIKNILKYQGEDFLLDPKMINALIDFQAYDQHPALKNIFRTLHQDGYVKKVKDAGNWDASCDQLVYEIERDYALPRDLVEYSLKSIGIGLGYNCKLPSSSTKSQNQQKPRPQAPTTPVKPWSKMTEIEKADFLETKVEIKESSFAAFGLKVENFSLSDFNKVDSVYYFNINYEFSRIGKSKDNYAYMTFALYDTNGKLRQSEDAYTEVKKIKQYYTGSWQFDSGLPFQKIGKLVIYMKEY